ncbi:MAG: D-aminoacylase, partial [Candidatus Aminicenantales bacterium]
MGTKLDLLVKGATILNGLGDAAFVADIGVKDKKIVFPCRADAQADTVIEGSGLLACPGFIDSHTHADLSILDTPGADNFIMQGVTSVVGGHCGISTSPVMDTAFFDSYMSGLGVDLKRSWTTFEEWLRAVEAAETAVNYIPLVGHNSLRGGILGLDYRRPSSAEEIENLKRELSKALDAGAFGLSAGFDAGTAGHYADRAEIIE